MHADVSEYSTIQALLHSDDAVIPADRGHGSVDTHTTFGASHTLVSISKRKTFEEGNRGTSLQDLETEELSVRDFILRQTTTRREKLSQL